MLRYHNQCRGIRPIPKITPYLLYKKHENPDCQQLLQVVRYLHSLHIEARPQFIIEKNFPPWVQGQALPCIQVDQGSFYSGLEAVMRWLEKETGIKDLLERAIAWTSGHLDYRLTDHEKNLN